MYAGWTPAHKATYVELLFLSQDEKNQVLTTYIWYRQVSKPALCPPPHFLEQDLPFQEGLLHLRVLGTSESLMREGGGKFMGIFSMRSRSLGSPNSALGVEGN